MGVYNSPVKFTIDYPEKLSRGTLILRTLFAFVYVLIPHAFMLFFYGIGVSVVYIIAWFAVLFTGRYPRGMFEYIVGYRRWIERVCAYMMFLTDVYPPFSGKE